MRSDDNLLEPFEEYEEQFDPVRTDRQARRKRKPKVRHTPKKSHGQIIAELADETAEFEAGFETTYRPSKHEQGWLLGSLRAFYEEALIGDVLALVKGGKEASVYRCRANPDTTGVNLLAAKVYRPRMFRTLRNDKMYREGRQYLTADGHDIKGNEHRIIRAIGKKTEYGIQVAQTSWLMHEYTALERLYRAGAAVPRPVAASDNAILMSYHGDERLAAPTLNTVNLERDEAETLFREVMRNVELMLQHDLVHGDLSAYNILYQALGDSRGAITIIDFPQVVNSHGNDHAYAIFARDIERVCEYFAQQGATCDPAAITDRLWEHYAGVDLDTRLADLSREWEEG